MDKGNKDGHRVGIKGVPGLGKVVEQSKWGADTARARYGSPDSSGMKAKDTSQPQFEEDQGAKGYPSDHKMDWVRGAGESAEGKPGYIPGGGRTKRG
jgi:hypothetical protein